MSRYCDLINYKLAKNIFTPTLSYEEFAGELYIHLKNVILAFEQGISLLNSISASMSIIKLIKNLYFGFMTLKNLDDNYYKVQQILNFLSSRSRDLQDLDQAFTYILQKNNIDNNIFLTSKFRGIEAIDKLLEFIETNKLTFEEDEKKTVV